MTAGNLTIYGLSAVIFLGLRAIAFALRGPPLQSSMFQPTLSFNCSHTSRAGRGDCLPEYRILNVTTGEHTRDVRARRIRLGLDIAEAVEIDLAFEDLGVWIVSDCYKQPVDLEFRRLLCLYIPEF